MAQNAQQEALALHPEFEDAGFQDSIKYQLEDGPYHYNTLLAIYGIDQHTSAALALGTVLFQMAEANEIAHKGEHYGLSNNIKNPVQPNPFQ